jgi:pantothenate kinase type III
LIHYIAAQLRQQTETKVILTGGGAEELLPLLPNDMNYVPELVLLGLAAVANSTNLV